MSILFKYIIREILKYFFIIAAIVVTVYIAIDFVGKLESLLKSDLSLPEFLIFFLLEIPAVVTQITPVAVLLGTLIVFGLMRRNNEITALKSSGLGIGGLLKPAAAAGAGLCLFLFLLSEAVVPAATAKANLFWLQKVRHKVSTTIKRDDIWIKDSGVIMHINHYNPDQKMAYGITLNFFNDRFDLIRRIDARQGIYTKSGWRFSDVMDHRFNESGDTTSAADAEPLTINLDIVPEDVGRAAKSSEEMGFVELWRHIQKIAAQGYSTTALRVDLQAKIAFPFVCLLMSLLGTGLSASGKARGGIAATIAYGLGISFTYWILHSFCLSMGYGSILPPIVAAWTANIVFSLLALALLAKAW